MLTTSPITNSEMLTYYVIDAKIKKLSKDRKDLKKKILKDMGTSLSLEGRFFTATLTLTDKMILNTDLVRDYLGESLPSFLRSNTAKTLSVTENKDAK